jgi:hypothetical protein
MLEAHEGDDMKALYVPALALALLVELAGATMAQTPPSSLVADAPRCDVSGSRNIRCAPNPATTGDGEIQSTAPRR